MTPLEERRRLWETGRRKVSDAVRHEGRLKCFDVRAVSTEAVPFRTLTLIGPSRHAWRQLGGSTEFIEPMTSGRIECPTCRPALGKQRS